MPFIKELRERGTPPDATVLNGQFDSKVQVRPPSLCCARTIRGIMLVLCCERRTLPQAELCNRIAKELGFNLDNGRLDVSVHPFTGGEPRSAGAFSCCHIHDNKMQSKLHKDLLCHIHANSQLTGGPRLAGAHPTDVRMTTRFKPDDLTEGLTGAIHETGHALYEQGRNLQFDGLPVNEVRFLVLPRVTVACNVAQSTA